MSDQQLLTLLKDSAEPPEAVRRSAARLLDAGADPNSFLEPEGGGWSMTALYLAADREDLDLVRLLLDRGATPDEDAFYKACEQSDLAYLDALYAPGFEDLINHKLDFEDAIGLAWFLDHGADINRLDSLVWAIGRGRGVELLQMLIDAGADINRADRRVRRRPMEMAACCGHLAAYELLEGLGATADLDEVARAVLDVARGLSTELPNTPPVMLGIADEHRAWLLGQFALLGRTEVVAALIAAGVPVDSRGWSNFTPLDQAAMSGRVDTVRVLVAAGADLTDRAFDDDGPTPLDCAHWGEKNNRTADGDYPGTIAALVEAGAPPSRHRER